MTTGFDIGGVSGRPIRGSDNAYGFQEGLVTTDGIRESTWQDALELAGLYIQYSDRRVHLVGHFLSMTTRTFA